MSTLRGGLAYEAWPAWRRDPSVYVGAIFDSMFGAFLYRLSPEAELVDAAVARLAEVPASSRPAVRTLTPPWRPRC